MKRPSLLLFLICIALVWAGSTLSLLAAPAAQEPRPIIAQPAQNAPVRGEVQIVGSATHPQFQRYELYFTAWPPPSDQSWVFIGEAHFNPVQLGLLGTWDSRSVTDGRYGLRVRVVKQDGNYLDSEPRIVEVANFREVASPTPEVAEATAEPLPTPVEEVVSVPTVPVVVPTIEAPPTVQRPTPTPEPEVTPILASGSGSNAGQTEGTAASLTDQLFNPARLVDAVKKAAMYTVAAFVLIGAFFAVKAVLVWLWQKIRP
jgi:hypothetical protein